MSSEIPSFPYVDVRLIDLRSPESMMLLAQLKATVQYPKQCSTPIDDHNTSNVDFPEVKTLDAVMNLVDVVTNEGKDSNHFTKFEISRLESLQFDDFPQSLSSKTTAT